MIRRSQVHEPGEGQGSSSKEQGYQHEIMEARCTLCESGIGVAAKDKAEVDVELVDKLLEAGASVISEVISNS